MPKVMKIKQVRRAGNREVSHSNLFVVTLTIKNTYFRKAKTSGVIQGFRSSFISFGQSWTGVTGFWLLH